MLVTTLTTADTAYQKSTIIYITKVIVWHEKIDLLLNEQPLFLALFETVSMSDKHNCYLH